MKKAIVIGVGVVAAIGLLAGFAARHEMRPKHAYGFLTYRLNSVMDDIQASDSQRSQVNAIKDDLFNDGMALKQSHQALRRELIAQWDSPTVDSAKLHAIVNERIDALRAFANKAADDAVKVHDLLTPEQRSQLKQELEEHAHSHE